jgi:hypothetical protein
MGNYSGLAGKPPISVQAPDEKETLPGDEHKM